MECQRKDASAEQARAGMAWAFRRYLTDPEILRLEDAARPARLGLWFDKEPVPPWEWRKMVKAANSHARDMSQYETRTIGSTTLELLAPLASQVSFSDFCVPAGTVEFVAGNEFLKNSNLTLFRITSEAYKLEAIVDSGKVFVRRNGLYQHSETYLGQDDCCVAIQWDTGSIACGINIVGSSDPMDSHMRAVRTPLTTPPAQLIEDLRRHSLLPHQLYHSSDHLFGTLLDCIHLSELDIRRHGSEKLVWGKGGDRDRPLDEPDISKLLAIPLTAHCGARGIDVICESNAGSGKLDFYVVANVSGRGLVRVALEAKKADSPRLIPGFTDQLPEYMRRLGTDYGIYIVYWLKSERYPHPVEDSYPVLEISRLHPLPRIATVRTVGVDFSAGPPPSRG